MARNTLRTIQHPRRLIRIALVAAFLWAAVGAAPTTEAAWIRVGEEIPTLTRA